MKKPLKILHIVSVMNQGGVENLLMNLLRNIDKKSIHFDFLATRKDIGVFDKEIHELGSKIYKIPHIKKVGFIKFIKNLDDFFKKHKEYKIVHCHMNSWASLFLSVAKFNFVPIRIAHSHTSNVKIDTSTIKKFTKTLILESMRYFANFPTNYYMACSKKAGNWMFGDKLKDKIIILNNGVEYKKYRFNQEFRSKIRKELGYKTNDFIIGHVGGFRYPKNHDFIIDIFNEIVKTDVNSKLCLVGNGALLSEIKTKVENKGLGKKCDFLGSRNDVNQILSAFDLFLMPSLFEGFPVTLVEAQAASLPCLVSDVITKEVDLKMGLIEYLSLQSKPGYWAQRSLEMKNFNRNQSYNFNMDFDIKHVANFLEKYYYDVYKIETKRR